MAVLLLTLLLLLVPNFVIGIESETKMTKTGPSVCLTSTAVVTKYINSVCDKGSSLFIVGQFNRIGSTHASSFAVMDKSTEKITFLGSIG